MIVLQAQAHFVGQMEMHPDRFYRREVPRMLRQAAGKLASFVHADADDVVFVTNTTTGMNAVLRSVDLQNDDEVLCLDLTCTWSSVHQLNFMETDNFVFICMNRSIGAQYVAPPLFLYARICRAQGR